MVKWIIISTWNGGDKLRIQNTRVVPLCWNQKFFSELFVSKLSDTLWKKYQNNYYLVYCHLSHFPQKFTISFYAEIFWQQMRLLTTKSRIMQLPKWGADTSLNNKWSKGNTFQFCKKWPVQSHQSSSTVIKTKKKMQCLFVNMQNLDNLYVV